tara:strand:+ start:172 stop:729 length:558 start_codon:yes stop_codon:yes gene_type:complete
MKCFDNPEKYTLHKKIAEGGFSKVYYATQEDNVYALKIMVEKKNKCDMIYEVEPFVTGMPLYSREYALNYIMHHMKLSGFSCTYMGESYLYISWGQRKKSIRQNEDEQKKEKRRKQYEIQRIVHAPEYKHNPVVVNDQKVAPSNSTVHIQNPGAFMSSIQQDKPDFSIANLKKLRQTAKQIRNTN